MDSSMHRSQADVKDNGMQVKLDIVGAKNIAVTPGCKGSLFVRYYVDKFLTVNTKEVEASSEPKWKEIFWLECGEQGMHELLFEVRWRRPRRRVFGGVKSKVVGWLQVSWVELLSSPTLSINNCFPLHSSVTQEPPPSLKHGIQIYEFEKQKDFSKNDSWGNADGKVIMCRSISVDRHMRRLEREECECAGRICTSEREANGGICMVHASSFSEP